MNEVGRIALKEKCDEKTSKHCKKPQLVQQLLVGCGCVALNSTTIILN